MKNEIYRKRILKKFEIKAIRYCTGFNTDLRKKYPQKKYYEKYIKLCDFIRDNIVNLFGADYCFAPEYDPADDSEWSEREKFIEFIANLVMKGLHI